MVLVICLLSLVSSEFPESNGVWELTDETLREALKVQPDLLVEFYAPWCEHCQKYAPEYSKLAEMLKAQEPPIRIARVDGSRYDDLAKKYDITSFPTLKFFQKGSPTDYTESKKSEVLFEYVSQKSKSHVKYVPCGCHLKETLSENPVNVILFSKSGTEELESFEDASKEIEKVGFLHIDSEDLAEEYGVKPPGIILLKDFEEKRNDYKGRFDKFAITKFIRDYKNPKVIKFTFQAVEILFKQGSPGIFLLNNEYSKYEEVYSKLAENFRENLLFVQDDLATAYEGKLSSFLGLTPEVQPMVLILDSVNQLAKYKYEGKFEYEYLAEFIRGWKTGKLKALPKSQPIPLEPYDQNVRVLVGSNYDSVTKDKTKNVLVEFYAPWCGHCKDFASVYQELAEKYKENSSVVIAKIDGTENEVPGVKIEGFPTFFYYPASQKEGIEFEGDRSLQGLESFIKEYQVKSDL